MKTFSAVCSINRDYLWRPTVTMTVKAVKVTVGDRISVEFESQEDMDRFWQLRQSSFVELVTR